MPVLRLAGAAPVQSLRQQSRSATGGRGLARLRGALAAAQVALALTAARRRRRSCSPASRRLQQVDLGLPRRSRAGAGGAPADRALRRAATGRLPGGARQAPRGHPGRDRGGRHLAPAGDRQLPPVEHAHPIGPAGRHAARPDAVRHAAAVRVGRRVRRARHPGARRPRLRRPRRRRRADARGRQRELRARRRFPACPSTRCSVSASRPAGRRCRSSASSATSRSTSTARRR